MLLLIVAATWATAAGMDRGRLSPDGVENVALSHYLRTTGSFSEDGQEPSFLREPLAIAITAAHMAWLTDVPESATVQQLATDPHYLSQILRVNLYYLVGLLFAVWWLARLLTRSHLVAAGAILGTALFSTVRYHSGNLLTESLAGLTVVLACAAMVWLVKTRRHRAALLAGALLGGVALTKAAGLYVGFVAMPALALVLLLFGLLSRRRALIVLLLMTASFALVVGPWMTRNYLQFGDFAISQRAGVVLYTRALKDTMSAEEYWGSFYAYAPGALRTSVFEKVLGFEPRDLRPGGRYERLIRYPPGEERAALAGEVEHTVSFFGRAWATKVRLEKQMAAAGLPESEADRVLQERAAKIISESPAKHLALTIPFAWRGIWSFDGRTLPAEVTNLIAFMSLLTLPGVAIWRRRADWFALALLPAGLFWFHALFTHFIPRYSEPLIPVAVLSVLVLLHALYSGLRKRRAAVSR